MFAGRYLDVGGLQTWVAGNPTDDAVVLLHGGLHHSEGTLGTLAAPFAPMPVVAFDRPAHGRTADPRTPDHFVDMARHAIGVLERLGGKPRHLVGYSDGAIVALYVALMKPTLVKSAVLMGGRYDPDASEPEGLTPGDEHFEMLNREHAEQSPDGPGHFAEVAARIMRLWKAEPNLTLGDLETVRVPVLVMAGDGESVEYTNRMYQALPLAQLAIVPGTSHGMPFEKPDLVVRLIKDFIGWAEAQPPATPQ